MLRRLVSFSLLAALAVAATGCLKQGGESVEDEEDEKSFIVGRWAFRRLNEAELAVADKNYAEAKKKLAEMRDNEDLNDHEHALMWQMLGNIYVAENNYPYAVKALEKCVELDALPEESQSTAQYNLGQLYAITGDYKGAIRLLEAWIAKLKTEPSTEIQLMLANCYVQTGQFKKALPYAEAVAKKQNPREENVLQLLLAIHFELDNQKKIVELLTELIERFPKKAYWLQLSAAYGQLKDDKRALAVLELAYRQEMLTDESELLTLAQHYLHMELPFEAAQLIEREQKAGRVSKSPENLELLASAWMAARETNKALKALAGSAREANSGDNYMRLGQLYLQQANWSDAAAALSRAIKKGGLKDPGNAQLLLGNARYELGQRSAAMSAFQAATKHDNSKGAAERWIEVMRKENESCPTGKEPACKLLPGHGK